VIESRPTDIGSRPADEKSRPAVTECLINEAIESANGMVTPARVTVDRPTLTADRHPPGEGWVELPDEISIAVSKHAIAWQEAMRPSWRRDLALVVNRLGLSADDVITLLDRWVAARDAARERGTFERELSSRQLPALTELWWSRSTAWVLRELEAMRRGKSPAVDLDPAPEVSRSAEVIDFRAQLRGER
jgi:hypothetical protein